MKEVTIVFLHEDCFGPNWDYVLAVCLTEDKAKEWIKTHPLNKKMQKENRGLIEPKWSYRYETFKIEK